MNTFTETEPGAPTETHYRVEKELARTRTAYQEIVLFTSPGLGRVLALDGIVQLTELDAYVYHEMLAHPALCAHPAPRRVAIVGGGDGFLAAEVLKHSTVEQVVVHELDAEVVEVCRKEFGTFADPRISVEIGDAWSSLVGPYDVILCDLTDPVGPAERLFTVDFYRRCHDALAPGGVLAAQTESLHFHPSVVRSCRSAMESIFPSVAVAWGAMATYPGAWWTFTIGAASDPRVARRAPSLPTRLYDPAAHAWHFLPDSVLERC